MAHDVIYHLGICARAWTWHVFTGVLVTRAVQLTVRLITPQARDSS